MQYMGTIIFLLATAVLGLGVMANLADAAAVGGLGTMAMNSYYLLATPMYAAAVAAQLIWGKPRSA